MKVFRLERVGAGPGTVLFSCEHVLGASVDVVDAEEVRELLKHAAHLLHHSSCDCEGCVAIRREHAKKILDYLVQPG